MRQGDHDRYLGVHQRLPSPTGIPRLRSRSRHRIQKCHHTRTGSRRHNRTRSQPFCAISIRPRYTVVTKALPQSSWRGISGHLSNTAIKGSESTSSRCMNEQMSVVVHARIFVQIADQVSPDNSAKTLGDTCQRDPDEWCVSPQRACRDRTNIWDHNSAPSNALSPLPYAS